MLHSTAAGTRGEGESRTFILCDAPAPSRGPAGQDRMRISKVVVTGGTSWHHGKCESTQQEAG